VVYDVAPTCPSGSHLDAALVSFTHGGTTYHPAVHAGIFGTPDPDGLVLVYDGLLIHAGSGTTSTNYFPYQLTNNSTDGIYIVTEQELIQLGNNEATITNLAVRFETSSFTVTPASFQI